MEQVGAAMYETYSTSRDADKALLSERDQLFCTFLRAAGMANLDTQVEQGRSFRL